MVAEKGRPTGEGEKKEALFSEKGTNSFFNSEGEEKKNKKETFG